MQIDFDWDSKFDPDNAQQTFERMLSSADNRLLATMTETALNIESGAKRRSRVGPTGNMKGGWESKTESRGNSIVSEIGNNVHYARFHEFGTKYIEPAPMLRPALDEETRNLERRVRMAVIEAADEAGSV